MQQRLTAVRQRIATACAAVGRSPSEVTLVAVTKTVSLETAALLPSLGISDLGESRPQELWRKAPAIPATWHLVGHLQRNKVERTVPLTRLIHSADRFSLLETLEAFGTRTGRTIDVLLQINASGEPQKKGFAPDEVPRLLPFLLGLKRVRLCGLMTLAALEEDQEKCRPTFARLRQLRDDLQGALGELHPLGELSMGMSNDFEVAIEEGATMIRLGTALFEGIE